MKKYSVIENHVFLIEQIHAPVTAKGVALYTNYDPFLSKVLNNINYGWPNETEEQLNRYLTHKSEVSVDNS